MSSTILEAMDGRGVATLTLEPPGPAQRLRRRADRRAHRGAPRLGGDPGCPGRGPGQQRPQLLRRGRPRLDAPDGAPLLRGQPGRRRRRWRRCCTPSTCCPSRPSRWCRGRPTAAAWAGRVLRHGRRLRAGELLPDRGEARPDPGDHQPLRGQRDRRALGAPLLPDRRGLHRRPRPGDRAGARGGARGRAGGGGRGGAAGAPAGRAGRAGRRQGPGLPVRGAAGGRRPRRETGRRIALRRASAEGQEGIAAFLDKRPPAWRRQG